MDKRRALDRGQALFAAIVAVPAMLVGLVVLVFADAGGPEAVDPAGSARPVQPVSPATTGVSTSNIPAPNVPAPTSASSTPPPATTTPPADTPFARGVFGTHPHAAAQAAKWRSSRPADAVLMDRLARTPTATWFGDWTPNVRAAAADLVGAAAATGKRPVIVAYNIPERDCEGGYSSGGAANEADYKAWVRDLAAGIGTRPAAVILEPDALGHLCGDASAKYRMLGDAVTVLEAGAGTDVYLDAGHSEWLNTATAADRLRKAGVAKARGFSLNVSNFITTGETERYGEQIVSALGGKGHYVIDTSRNGNGEGDDWCNPPGRALGTEPTGDPAAAHADAYLWIKIPGESDGTCGGAPPAGTWMPEYALGLARAAYD